MVGEPPYWAAYPRMRRPDHMATPDLTVVISTHNRPIEVRESVQAVVDQDHPGPIETIVVFDKAEPDVSLISSDDLRPVHVIPNHRTPGLPGSATAGRRSRPLRCSASATTTTSGCPTRPPVSSNCWHGPGPRHQPVASRSWSMAAWSSAEEVVTNCSSISSFAPAASRPTWSLRWWVPTPSGQASGPWTKRCRGDMQKTTMGAPGDSSPADRGGTRAAGPRALGSTVLFSRSMGDHRRRSGIPLGPIPRVLDGSAWPGADRGPASVRSGSRRSADRRGSTGRAHARLVRPGTKGLAGSCRGVGCRSSERVLAELSVAGEELSVVHRKPAPEEAFGTGLAQFGSTFEVIQNLLGAYPARPHDQDVVGVVPSSVTPRFLAPLGTRRAAAASCWAYNQLRHVNRWQRYAVGAGLGVGRGAGLAADRLRLDRGPGSLLGLLEERLGVGLLQVGVGLVGSTRCGNPRFSCSEQVDARSPTPRSAGRHSHRILSVVRAGPCAIGPIRQCRL